MTREIRTTVEPKDVKAIEVECAKCHYRVVFAVDDWQREVLRCSNCDVHWADHRHALLQARDFAQYAHSLANKAEAGQPFTIRIELASQDDK